MERTNAWKKYTKEEDKKVVFDFAEGYRKFLSENKTERECCSFFEEQARAAGFQKLEDVIAAGTALKVGDKVYAVNKKKEIAAFVIGKRPLSEGTHILGAHIDSPR